MKLYVHEKGIVLVGKAWEIKRKLHEYGKQFTLLEEWVTSRPKKDK
ncbi:Z-ring formation inhibitor MciZ [Bacillus canaveralius]|uniref:Z-ring formation inhibitor MciZ n=1 Tax=Bacillus canaveralius TaxID=1403243 RepID=A0A2N5GRK8_9BACI|nr:Z-ring formation inhibitor MciZ [Bacillus canaveralius]PLR86064.1 Z-ring formation inhibitor MciZ [Bacillus canaveralius]PLS00183.1 Z-ring formation inhibitor MciZ [Bacillus canaveralius]